MGNTGAAQQPAAFSLPVAAADQDCAQTQNGDDDGDRRDPEADRSRDENQSEGSEPEDVADEHPDDSTKLSAVARRSVAMTPA
jgi:hypothetical protein